MTDPPTKEWELFISHASEDKKSFVDPLANALTGFGLSVWYDKFSLKLGDSLSRSIDEGLARARFGLVVLSPAFLAKKWPEYELRGLTAREMAGGKVILPIWHNVSRAEILAFSPPLADKFAIDSKGSTPVQIAVDAIKEVRPEIFERIMRRKAFFETQDSAQVVSYCPEEIRSSAIQHPKLSPDSVSRIRLIRAALLGVHPHSMEVWLDGFKRDSHPSREIEVWERIASVCLEYCRMQPTLSRERQRSVFTLALALSFTNDEGDIKNAANGLSADAIKTIVLLHGSPLPVYDIKDDSLLGETEDLSKTASAEQYDGDQEHFPNDPPEELVRALMKQRKTGKKKRLT